jgi:hypothetical protein
MSTLSDQELRRARWRRVRAGCHLLGTDDAAFARGGLAQRLDRPAARMLLLTDDPELASPAVDEDQLRRLAEAAEEWGAAHRIGSLWGSGKTATFDGACLFGSGGSSAAPWSHYLCLRRDGGLDVGLGSEVVWTQDDVTEFHLRAIVGRLWRALELHAELLQPQEGGRGEVVLALLGVGDGVLGGFAEGWREPFSGFRNEAPRCREDNILYRVELPEPPAGDSARDLAYQLGSLVENAWGSVSRRFLVRGGQGDGEFDWRFPI